MAEEQGDVEVKTPVGSLRARGTDIVMLLVFLVTTIQAATLYWHTEEAKRTGEAVAATNKEVAAALKESNIGFTKSLTELVRSQNLSTCLQATKENEREAEYSKPNSFCNRMAK